MKSTAIEGLHGVRYQSTDVQRAADFYTTHLGFKLEHQQLPAFASVSLGDFTLLLSGPGASGSRPMPGGQQQEPGGWNRVVLKVADLPGFIAELKKAGIVDKGMIPKVDSAVTAIRAGVEKVSLVDGRMQHAVLLEIFTDAGVGTEVVL